MKKRSSLYCSLFFLFALPILGADNKTKYFYFLPNFHFDEKGSISSEFWMPLPPIKPKNHSVKIIQNEKIWSLLKKLPSVSLDSNDYRSGEKKPKEIEILDQLKDFGFDFVSGVPTMVPMNDRFALWYLGQGCEEGVLYIIDSKSPVTAYDLKFCISPSFLDRKPKMDLSEKEHFKIYINSEICNGRLTGTPKLFIFDFDEKNEKCSLVSGSFFLDENKSDQIVLKKEVFWGLNWYWIFKRSGKEWVDVSASHPDFYKKTVYKELKDHDSYEFKESQAALEALREAALLGGPSAFAAPVKR
jgi:hypothetical protein